MKKNIRKNKSETCAKQNLLSLFLKILPNIFSFNLVCFASAKYDLLFIYQKLKAGILLHFLYYIKKKIILKIHKIDIYKITLNNFLVPIFELKNIITYI